jgi:hypothetical protein
MSETFSMIPAKSGPLVVIGIIGLFVISTLVLFAYIGYSARHTKFIISSEGLRIAGTLYSRMIPKDQILFEKVKAIDLNTTPELRPTWRTNGIGLPGYGAGWFKLKNKEKALLFVTDKSKVVYIPTNKGYSALLTVADGDKFIDSLRKIAIH